MPRRRTWTQAEVSKLLSLVETSGEAALLMASTSRPNEALWREISRGLAEAGYERSVAQCRSKWKVLKQTFHSERETRRRAGHHSSRLPQHYRAMKSIWKAAGRPVFGERRMPELVNLPSRKRRSALASRSSSSPEPPEHDVSSDAPGMLLSPPLQCAKNEPESPARGEHIVEVPLTPPTMPHTSCCFPLVSLLGCHTDPKQEGTEERAGPGVAGLLQNVQQLLVQILQTSQQQQALLERLASDTVSHLQFLSHSLVQVGETLHQLLLRPQTHPGPLGHYIPHVPLFEGGPGKPCSPGTLHTSPDCKEEAQLSPATGCTLP
ncbi:uncharacterized protein LOC114070105 isoform X2 [Empidonax traillii]|uniref:uncharacterized protein LOC114070105 isoform X2 n=1 Tax=Empidonax traillii TaxID=164674 RepID=UPI000FFD9C77|nr:uncharacterized protein LOC114070105 isoform X2 [Empidonax traillii]